MKNLINKLSIALVALALSAGAYGQIALTQTTLGAAINSTQTTFPVAATTGISVDSALFVVDPGRTHGELMRVTAVNSTTLRVTVLRGGGNQVAHVNGALVVIGPNNNAFQAYNPLGACAAANTRYTPWFNATTGESWLCSTVTLSWVPGFSRLTDNAGPTAAVASAAGQITASGPLFHITGTAAITGFTTPIGGFGREFCVIPDALFTTTTANNIGLATAAVVGKTLCFTNDPISGKLYPSY